MEKSLKKFTERTGSFCEWNHRSLFLKLLIGYKCENNKHYNRRAENYSRERENCNVDLRITMESERKRI